MQKIRFDLLFLKIVVFTLIFSIIAQQTLAASVAVVDFHNISGQKCLEPLTQSIPAQIINDLSRVNGISIVERKELDSLIKEQKFSLTELFDPDKEIEIGKLIGAEYYIKGSFERLGQDTRINVEVLNTSTGIKKGFSKVGRDENVIHKLSESVILHLTGKDIPITHDLSQPLFLECKAETPWYKKWYVWTLVAGVIVAIAVAASSVNVEGGAGGAGGGGAGG